MGNASLESRGRRVSPVSTSTMVTSAVVSLCVVLAACGSGITSGTSESSIAGRTFSVVSVAGRTLPTTVGVIGRFGTCDQQPVTKITLTFGKNASFVARFNAGDTFFEMEASFVEATLGEVVVIANDDTARLAEGTMRLPRVGIMCAQEELVAVPAT